MDPFTQRMLERAEQRAKNFGITSTLTKQPLNENNHQQIIQNTMEKQHQHQKSPTSSNVKRNSSTTTTPKSQKKNYDNVYDNADNIAENTKNEQRLSRKNIERQITVERKENVDLAVEINITSGPNVHVQVEVEEQEIDSDGNITTNKSNNNNSRILEPSAVIRDVSRNRLQRLGALYSDNEQLSSPIQRTEARFDEELVKNMFDSKNIQQRSTTNNNRPKYAKLAALADSINSWEDDDPSSNPDFNQIKRHKTIENKDDTNTEPRIVDTTPRKKTGAIPKNTIDHADKSKPVSPQQITKQPPVPPSFPNSATTTIAPSTNREQQQSPSKQLKWDQKVMDALELQGFKRRESNTEKLSYDYSTSNQKELTPATHSTITSGTSSNPIKKFSSNANIQLNNNNNLSKDEITTGKNNKKQIEIAKGLVSDRAALFDKSNNNNNNVAGSGTSKTHKDPTEMSLKERMAMFEKNKGVALIPKAALGISASTKQIMTGKLGDKKLIQQQQQQQQLIQDEPDQQQDKNLPKLLPYNQPVLAETKASGSGIRNTVAALMANATTISETQISNEVRKQRENEMNVLMNRFTKQSPQKPQNDDGKQQQQQQLQIDNDKIIYKQTVPPPPPPLPPSSSNNSNNNNNNKRRSGEKRDDDSQDVRKSLDDIKRIKIIPPKKGQLYPNLYDIESETVTESEPDNHTTATLSSGGENDNNDDDDDDDDDDDNNGGDNVDRNKNYSNNIRNNRNNNNNNNNRNNRERGDEHEDSYMDSEDGDLSINGICNVSLGREIMHAVRLNESAAASASKNEQYLKNKQYQQQQQQQQQQQYLDSSTSERSGNFSDGEMDDYLDEALVDDDDDDDDDDGDDANDENEYNDNIKKRKGSISSNSFSYEKKPQRKHVHYQTVNEDDNEDDDNNYNINRNVKRSDFRSPVKSELKVDPSNDNNDIVTLTHTVSFYRRQQHSQQNHVSARKIIRKVDTQNDVITENDDDDDDDDDEYDDNVDNEFIANKQKITTNNKINKYNDEKSLLYKRDQELLDEICKQQQFIAQSSQALNLCAATIEFSGSTESVEAERHLLVACHRRQGALNELQRLRVQRCLRPSDLERGRLIIKDITVPLKQDYIRKLSADSISGHHLVCLAKYNENVLATKTVPTLPGLLAVKFPDTLQFTNVNSDFKIILEVYGMTAQREILPHDIKYHITPNKKGVIKTPKGKKGMESNRLVMPPVQSPAGPNAVRSPSLIQYGFIIFSLKEYQRNSWTLNQASVDISPLDGVIHMKVSCDISTTVEYKGFLTMFEDVSGFGAWHRRWCRLHGHLLSYWKYPDDENKKAPMGSIDLNVCNSKKITTAPRDICARLNTFLLELKRPTQENDVDSLTIVRHGKFTIVRCLLSADTKEERDEWCSKFNKTLNILRSWGDQPTSAEECTSST